MADRYRAYTPAGDVLFAGPVNDGGVAEFDAGLEVIAKVVFYSGPEDSEVVSDSVDINHSGPVHVLPVNEGVVSAAGTADGSGSAG